MPKDIRRFFTGGKPDVAKVQAAANGSGGLGTESAGSGKADATMEESPANTGKQGNKPVPDANKDTDMKPAKAAGRKRKTIVIDDSDDDFVADDHANEDDEDEMILEMEAEDDDDDDLPTAKKNARARKRSWSSTAKPKVNMESAKAPAAPAQAAKPPPSARKMPSSLAAPPPAAAVLPVAEPKASSAAAGKTGKPSPSASPGSGSKRAPKRAKVEEPVDAPKAAAMAAVADAIAKLPQEGDVKFSLMEDGGFGNRDDTPEMLGQKEAPRGHPDCLSGKTFVISGVLDSLTRQDAENLIKRHGGKVTSAVSGKTSFLLVGRATGQSKYRAAQQKGTKLIDEDGLFSLIKATESIKPADAPEPSPIKPSQTGAGAQVSVQAPPMYAGDSQLWVEKHKPKSSAELVGNNTIVATLKQWLQDWERVHILGQAPAETKKGYGGKPKDMGKKAVLLSGPPGIGKTSSALIVTRELGFNAVEVNASETRNKSDKGATGGIAGKLTNTIKELTTNTTINMGQQQTDKGARKVCLIMDEVDGMSGSDRGGVQDLILTIAKAKIPIICICNDKYNQKLKSLRNHCLELEYRKPTRQQITKRMLDIARKEGLAVNEAAMDALAESANGDIRLVLGQLQMIRLRAKHLSYDDVKGGMGAVKDFEMSPFEAARKLLVPEANQLTLADQCDLVFQDMDLVPLLIQENYVNHRPSIAQNDMMRMQIIAKAADAFSLGDTVSRDMRMRQNWSLMPFAGLVGSVYPASYVRGFREVFGLYPTEPNFPRFTAWLGNNSTSNKQKRLLGELHTRVISSDAAAVDRTHLRLYYVPALKPMLVQPLKQLEKEGIPVVVQLMHQYCLSKDDMEFLMDVTKFKTKAPWGADLYKDVPTIVKSAFTRAFNTSEVKPKTAAMLGDFKPKKARGSATAVVEEMEEVDAVPGEGVTAEQIAPANGGAEEEEDEDLDAAAKAEKAQRQLAKHGVSLTLKEMGGKGKGRGSASGRGSGAGSGRGRGSGRASGAPGRGSGRGRGRGKLSGSGRS